MRGGWFGLRGWGAEPVVSQRHAVSVEGRLSAARAVLSVVSLAALLVEHWGGLNHVGVGVLGAFALYSLVVAVVAHGWPADRRPPVLLLHLADVAWSTATVSANGGVEGPFFAYYLFVLLAAGYRWGLVETAATGTIAILTTGADVAVRAALVPDYLPDFHAATIRLLYLLVGAALIGYLAEDERRHRQRTWAVSQILGRVRPHAGLVSSVQNVLDSVLRHVDARRAVLVLGEDGEERVLLWEAEAEASGGGGKRTAVHLRQESRDACRTWLFDVPAGADAWKAVVGRHRSATELRVVAIDRFATRADVAVDATPLLDAPFTWKTAFCLSVVEGEGWSGRLFVFDPRVSDLGGRVLRFLQVVVGQAGPALFNLYLQRRLQSRSGVLERTQLSRQLHDGVIQSLIGIEMQLEVLRRQAPAVAAASIAVELAALQNVLSDEILNLRDLMQVLKPLEVSPDQLVEHLAGAVAHFRNRTQIDARLSCAAQDIDLSRRACREVAAVVLEALANVRKHSGATSVLVRLERRDGNWLLSIGDNGSGYGFDGTLDHEQLDARHLGPVIIKERLRSIGATLTLWSQPGVGSRLDATIPGRHHA
ncbi:MAG TPA: histidine kinase [Vicinamibacterales bacterium]|nr:histidine kinase [Vicinamibacterales bacterium]